MPLMLKSNLMSLNTTVNGGKRSKKGRARSGSEGGNYEEIQRGTVERRG